MLDLQQWERCAESVRCVLPKPLCMPRCELLPQVLLEWDRSALEEHLSREPRAHIRKRIKKLDTVTKLARLLQEALDKLERVDRSAIVLQMIRAGRGIEEVNWKELAHRIARLEWLSEYLAKVGGVQTSEIWKLRPGQPPNLAPYLVLQDAAAIFEWLTGVKATRHVDRDNYTETGPFFQFASILWPIIFKKGTAGLPAAMKNWAEWRSEHNERSALIANIAARHPGWGPGNTPHETASVMFAT
jgi:hypothetical protein